MARWAFFTNNEFIDDAYNFDSARIIYVELRKKFTSDEITVIVDGHSDCYPPERYDEIFGIDTTEQKNHMINVDEN